MASYLCRVTLEATQNLDWVTGLFHCFHLFRLPPPAAAHNSAVVGRLRDGHLLQSGAR